jgi:hypothetical protein
MKPGGEDRRICRLPRARGTRCYWEKSRRRKPDKYFAPRLKR